MSFAMPLAFALLLPIALLFAWRARSRQPAMAVADAGLFAAAHRSTLRMRLRRLPDVLRLIAAVLLVLAIARPREGLAVTSVPEEGIDIVAAVDVSSSMTQRVSPDETRLEAARAVLEDFAESLSGNRMGLVAFQDGVLTLSPLTNDVSAIQARVDQLDPSLMMDGTAIGLGIMEALTILEESPARSRVVVLLTDGENNAGDISPFDAARVAQALGIRLYTIGFVGGISQTVDTSALRELASITGGEYFDARTSEELQAAYDEISDLEQSRIGETRFVSFREFGPWFALGAAMVLLLDTALRATWLRRQP